MWGRQPDLWWNTYKFSCIGACWEILGFVQKWHTCVIRLLTHIVCQVEQRSGAPRWWHSVAAKTGPPAGPQVIPERNNRLAFCMLLSISPEQTNQLIPLISWTDTHRRDLKAPTHACLHVQHKHTLFCRLACLFSRKPWRCSLITTLRFWCHSRNGNAGLTLIDILYCLHQLHQSPELGEVTLRHE